MCVCVYMCVVILYYRVVLLTVCPLQVVVTQIHFLNVFKRTAKK